MLLWMIFELSIKKPFKQHLNSFFFEILVLLSAIQKNNIDSMLLKNAINYYLLLLVKGHVFYQTYKGPL